MNAVTANWLQAWGTIAGAIFAAAAAIAAFLVLVHEIRIRRRDEDDLRASTARLVIVTTGDEKGTRPKEDADGSVISMELYINNFSRFPVVDVSVMAERLNGKREFAWGTDLLKPSESVLLKCIFRPPLIWPYLIPPPLLFHTRMIFTDDNGLRWQRVDRQQPSRVFASTQLPEWDFWFKKADDSEDHELRPGRPLTLKRQTSWPFLPMVPIAANSGTSGQVLSRVEDRRSRRRRRS